MRARHARRVPRWLFAAEPSRRTAHLDDRTLIIFHVSADKRLSPVSTRLYCQFGDVFIRAMFTRARQSYLIYVGVLDLCKENYLEWLNNVTLKEVTVRQRILHNSR